MAGREPELEPGRAPLPAPYEAPWRRLAADGQAVAAGLRLKLRELGRLNREGTLARPAFWPAELAPLFWPLLLALALALLVAATVALAGGWGGPRGPVGPTSGSEARPAAEAAPSALANGPERSAPSDSPSPQAPLPDGEAASAVGDGPSPGGLPDPSGLPVPPVLPEPPPGPPPLLLELLGPEPPPWVLGLQERPAASLLQLQLGAEFARLPEPRRRAVAEAWLLRARELGYERLELLEPGGAVLARPARVGSGMILLDSPATPP